LAPGIYSVVVTGSLCGSASATVAVGTGTPGLQIILKPFCGIQAYMQPSIPGTNYQWYNGTTPVPSPVGTASIYPIPNPTSGQIVNLSYNAQGCHDTIQFILQSAAPGILNVPNTGFVCPNSSNGTATISLIPALNAPPGINTFSVFSTGGTPVYMSSVSPT